MDYHDLEKLHEEQMRREMAGLNEGLFEYFQEEGAWNVLGRCENDRLILCTADVDRILTCKTWWHCAKEHLQATHSPDCIRRFEAEFWDDQALTARQNAILGPSATTWNRTIVVYGLLTNGIRRPNSIADLADERDYLTILQWLYDAVNPVGPTVGDQMREWRERHPAPKSANEHKAWREAHSAEFVRLERERLNPASVPTNNRELGKMLKLVKGSFPKRKLAIDEPSIIARSFAQCLFENQRIPTDLDLRQAVGPKLEQFGKASTWNTYDRTRKRLGLAFLPES